MQRTAVLLTVYNRKNVTLRGLRSLYSAINRLGGDHAFDIYMTNDGCTDGTGEAVAREFSQVHIIKSDGNLYWSGGMRKAWQAAIDSGIDYDFYLWFNDDAELYEDALVTMFHSIEATDGRAIICGAFCDKDGNVSYGGRDREFHFICPNGVLQKLVFMNGNLVLIPNMIGKKLGNIDFVYKHSMGDWDYGCRAIEAGFDVLLTDRFVGMTERHDQDLKPYLDVRNSLRKRFSLLYSSKYSIIVECAFVNRHMGVWASVRKFVAQNLYTLLPYLYNECRKESCTVTID